MLCARRALDRTSSPRQRAVDRHARATCNRAATRWWSSSTTKRSCAAPIGWWTWGPGRAGTAAASSPRARPGNSPPIRPSLTGRYLAGTEKIPVPEHRRRVAKTRAITIEGVTTNNLKNLSVQFPLSALGVRDGRERFGQELAVERNAGPGPGAAAGRHRRQARPAHQPPRRQPDRQGGADRSVAHRADAAEQSGHLCRRVRRDSQGVRQHPRRPRTRLQGGPLQLQREGRPLRRVSGTGAAADRDELPPRSLRPCPVCEGKRFNRQTLEIHYRDRSIADVLDMRVEEAAEFFENFPVIARLVGSLQRGRARTT